MSRWLVAILTIVAAVGCGEGGGGGGGTLLDRQALLDPETCRQCHPDHVREWSGSMHAYAFDDPVFHALNRLGQEETGGELGDFCVNCHAPMAVREGVTVDGLDIDAVPRELRGVTCYFCHQVDAVEGTHNNPLRLAEDGVMRGAFDDAVENGAHASAASPLHDRRQLASSDLCGSCHDIVTPAGVHLERTFSEWSGSLYASPSSGQSLSCSGCHMRGRRGIAAQADGVVQRRIHDHSFPGVDVALTDFPETEAQRELVQAELDSTLIATLCVSPLVGGATVTLDNAFVGHQWPSGAAQDRRAWVELVAYFGDREIFSTGVVADDEPLPLDEPGLWVLRDKLFDADGNEVHTFWEAREVESNLLPVASTPVLGEPGSNHSERRQIIIPGPFPDRVTMRVRMRPFALDILGGLVDAGRLAAEIPGRIPTFTLGSTVLEWRQEEHGASCVPR